MASTTNRIKILYTIPNFDTAGSGKALLHVAKRLNPEQFEVHIACFHNRGSFFKVVENSGIPVHILQYTTTMKPYYRGLLNCYAISRMLKKIQPDIIHSFHYAADYSEALSAKMAGIKWIYTKKNMSWGGSSKNSWNLRTRLADAISVQNTDMMRQFFNHSKKATLIPRGVDTTIFKPLPANELIRKQWNILPEDRVFMCVANMVPVKGIEILLKAFAKTVTKHPNWKLLLVGDYNNDYGKKMVELQKQLNLNKEVIFCGKQEHIVDYLSIAEMVVLPTLNEGRKEGSPVSLLEAMAAGKNVLASNVSGINDQLAHFKKHLVEAGNTDVWASALNANFDLSKAQHSSIGEEFRTHVLKNYPIELEVKRCEQLYLKLYES
ncbi:glycosyltransferase [Psychroserpens mesophilus]|uniref:glycosyltransferase n=1 Tax=Psychroserpens mesophilus TaxID=325473 RepID=UPI003D6564BE